MMIVFAGNACHRRDQGHPSAPSVDFVEAQENAGAKPRFDGANVPFDLSPGLDRLAVPSIQGLGQASLEMIAGLHRPGIKMIRNLDQEDRALGHDIGRHILRHYRKTEKCDQGDS